MHRIAFLLLAAASFALSGCTFIGMGIGAAASKTTPVSSAHLEDDVVVTTTEGERIEGTVTGAMGDDVTVQAHGRCGKEWFAPPCRVTTLSKEHIRTMVKEKSYVGLGIAIGGIIDLACLAASIAGFVAFKNSPGGLFGSNSF